MIFVFPTSEAANTKQQFVLNWHFVASQDDDIISDTAFWRRLLLPNIFKPVPLINISACNTNNSKMSALDQTSCNTNSLHVSHHPRCLHVKRSSAANLRIHGICAIICSNTITTGTSELKWLLYDALLRQQTEAVKINIRFVAANNHLG